MLRVCLECGKNLTGRKDKKFCDHHCRSSFHYKTKEDYRHLVHSIHKTIKRNRDILALLVENDSSVVSVETLNLIGFQFSYLSHEMTGNHPERVRCCYDYGYAYTDNGHIEIYDLTSFNQLRLRQASHSKYLSSISH